MADLDPLAAALEHMGPASEDQGNSGHDTAAEMGKAIRALTLRIGRASYAQIAEQLGYADPASARHLVMRALSRRESEQVEELRALENAALDADETELRLIIGDRSKPEGVRLRAIDTRTRLSARRARLNGMDAPVQVEVSPGVQQQLQAGLTSLREAVYGLVVEGEVTDVSDERLEG